MSKYKKPKVGFLDHVAGKQNETKPVDEVLKEAAESAPEPKQTKPQTKKPVIKEEVKPSAPGMEHYVKATQVDPKSAKGSFDDKAVEGYVPPVIQEQKLESDPNKMSAYQKALQESKKKKKDSVAHLGEAADALGGEAEKPVTQADLKQLKISLASLGGGGVGPEEVKRIINDYRPTLNDSDRQAIIDAVDTIILGNTDSLPEGDLNLYYTESRDDSNFSKNLSLINTDDIAEGSTNLYYNDSRARSAIQSIDSALIYDQVTGNLAFNQNYEGRYTQTNFDSDFALKTTDSLSEGSTNRYYHDSLVEIFVDSDYINARVDTQVLSNTDSLAEGSSNLYYTTARHDSDTLKQVDSAYINARIETQVLSNTDSLAEGAVNLYYTDSRARSAISSGDSYIQYDSATGVLTFDASVIPEGYTSEDFDSDFLTKNTDSLTEGLVNLYYTTARFDSDATEIVARIDSDDIEIQNLKNRVDELDVNSAIVVQWNQILSFDSDVDSVPRGEYGVHFDGSGTDYINVDKFYFNCFDRNDIFVPFSGVLDSGDIVVISDSDGGIARYEVAGLTDFGNHFRVDVTALLGNGGPADTISAKLYPATDNSSLASYDYVDAQDKIIQDQIDSDLPLKYVNVTGDTMTGSLNMLSNINMSGYKVTGLADPVQPAQAANKRYVDAGDSYLQEQIDAIDSAYVNVTGDTMTGSLTIDSADMTVNGGGHITVEGGGNVRVFDGGKVLTNKISSVGNSNIQIERNGSRRFLVGDGYNIADRKIRYNPGYNRDSYTSDLEGTDSYTLMPKWYVDDAVAAGDFVSRTGDSMTGTLSFNGRHKTVISIDPDSEQYLDLFASGDSADFAIRLLGGASNADNGLKIRATDAQFVMTSGNFIYKRAADDFNGNGQVQSRLSGSRAPSEIDYLKVKYRSSNGSEVDPAPKVGSFLRVHKGPNYADYEITGVTELAEAWELDLVYLQTVGSMTFFFNDNLRISTFGALDMVSFSAGGDVKYLTYVDMNSNRITELGDPVDSYDAVHKTYVDSAIANSSFSVDSDLFVSTAGDSMTGALTISRPEGSIALKINKNDQERIRFRSDGRINWTGNATDARLNKDGGNFTISLNNNTYMKFDLAQGEIEVNKTLTLAAPDPVINLPNNSDVGQLASNSNRRLYWDQNNVGIDVPLELNADTALIIQPEDGESQRITFFKNKTNTDVSKVNLKLVGNSAYNQFTIWGGSNSNTEMMEFRSDGRITIKEPLYMGDNINMQNYKITGLADPAVDGQAATKRYVDAEVAAASFSSNVFVAATDPTLSDSVAEGQFWYDTVNSLLSVREGSSWDGVVNGSVLSTIVDSDYVQARQSTDYLPLTGGTVTGALNMKADVNMGGKKVTGMGDPTAAGQAATKRYVDAKFDTLSPPVIGRTFIYNGSGAGSPGLHNFSTNDTQWNFHAEDLEGRIFKHTGSDFDWSNPIKMVIRDEDGYMVIAAELPTRTDSQANILRFGKNTSKGYKLLFGIPERDLVDGETYSVSIEGYF